MTSEPKSLSELRFASLLVYSPRGQGEVSVQSRQVRDGVKNDTPPMIPRAVERLVTTVDRALLDEFELECENRVHEMDLAVIVDIRRALAGRRRRR